MRTFLTILFVLSLLIFITLPAEAQTVANQDSCQIATNPAATLLLPYFEVDFQSPRPTAHDTAFTIVNVSNTPAIAHVTVWSEWSFPVIDFNVWLTGYDVQSISLWDLLVRGLLPQTSSDGEKGIRSSDAPPGHLAPGAVDACADLPGMIPFDLLNAVRMALVGLPYIYSGSLFCQRVSGPHANAVGYVTIDVANTCSQSLPSDPAYFATEILFDNQLTGDYLYINPNPATGNYAGGMPLVHIQAVPAGGPAGVMPTTLTRTFYQRYQGGVGTADRRQPLPSAFAARIISGGRSTLATQLKIWRQGPYSGQGCSPSQIGQNASFPVTDFVRFDEHENSSTIAGCQVSPCPPSIPMLPETASVPVTSSIFPPLSSGDIGGWMYLNLDNPNQAGPQQNWVVVEMTGEGRYQVNFDATYLANGCSPAFFNTTGETATGSIGPQ